MAWTDPPTFVSGGTATAANMNILGADLLYLKGITDGVTFSGASVNRAGAGSQSIPNATDTDVTLTNEVFDFGGWWTSGASFVVPASAIPDGYATIAGLLIARVRFVSNATGARKLIVLKNGAEVDALNVGSIAGGDPTVVSVTTFFTVAVTDAVKLQVHQSSGGALNMDAASLTFVRFAPAA